MIWKPVSHASMPKHAISKLYEHYRFLKFLRVRTWLSPRREKFTGARRRASSRRPLPRF
jgi:hypothetical protein